MTTPDISLIPDNPSSPPGRTRIMNSMIRLLDVREFNRITTAEIAREAEVTEGLIYKYFRDKKDLLYQVLMELFRQVIDKIESETAAVSGAHEKLKTFIRASVASYADSRVFSRIILLEVRNSQSFFASNAYGLVRQYSGMLARILQEGMDAGEFAPDIEIRALREIIFDIGIHNVKRLVSDACKLRIQVINQNGCGRRHPCGLYARAMNLGFFW